MTRIFVCLFMVLSLYVNAQQAFTVIYEYDTGNSYNGKMKFLLAVNDSVSFETIIYHAGKKAKYAKPLGSGFRSHDAYININKNLELRQSHYKGHTKLLVQDTIRKLEWYATDEERNILGYNCKKAVAQYNGQRYTAWYTNTIPLPFGPSRTGGLPGLILELTYDNFGRTYTAISITAGTETIVEPTKGKRITPDQYPTN